ncbi:MAG: hypothetical protein IPK85_13800 [Gemmatimonadetes bacterium]|nr:hypothetical protein [Gemmatimonadota bacterium]
MTRPRDHFGPPYSEAELAEERAFHAAHPEDGELDTLGHFLAGRVRPRPVDLVAPDAVTSLERAIANSLATTPARPIGPPARPRLNLLVRVVGRVGVAAIFATCAGSVVLYLNEDPRHDVLRPTYTRSPRVEFDFSSGGRALGKAQHDADGVERVTVVGPITLTVTQPPPAERAPGERVALRLVTREHIVDMFEGQLAVSFDRSGQEILTLLSPGKANYRLRTEGPERLRPLKLTSP